MLATVASPVVVTLPRVALREELPLVAAAEMLLVVTAVPVRLNVLQWWW